MATDFEAYTHEQLLAMIASLDSATVVARATQLQGAAIAIKDIGESLRKHQVKGWEGVAADAFQQWVTRAGNATLRLAEYSEEGSKWMTHAAQTMVEVKTNTPKYDTSAAADLAAAHRFHNDPDSQQLGRAANSKLNGDRQEAIQQLTKLAQSYDLSATQMNKAEAPTFRPPPPEFAPYGVGYEELSRARSGEVSSGASGAGGASYASPAVGGEAPATGPGWSPGPHSSPDFNLPPSGTPLAPSVAAIPGREVEVGLDHVVTLPEKILPPAAGMPEIGPVSPGGGMNPVVPVPPLSLPPTASLKGPGSGPLLGVKPPGGIGDSRVVGLPPRDTGIVGGRSVSPGGPNAGIPRGTVIGAEGTQSGGRGGMMGGGGVGSPHSPSGSGSAAGRRLAMEPGGVVGGRQSALGSRSVAGGQPFTQGGSGLVRNGSGVGATGHPGVPTPGKRRGGQGGERPDYLAEDDETWQGNRRVVPPVID
ncbi:WXG100 family type VII secretion target [Streptomyces lavendulae]|uniref:WXG100 family type VII secretion target n=1 Tax=Streptomyces lavendulae TaxID=1914 RepID=UPI00371C4B6E